MCKFPIKIPRPFVSKDTTPYVCDDGNPYFLVPCGRCVDCIKKRKNDWYVRARLEQESGLYKQILWCSFTFRDDRLPIDKYDLSAKIRAFKDRLRKFLGYFPTHFFISERGGKDCDGRIHLHGFLFFKEPIKYKDLHHYWADFEGFSWIEPIRDLKAITYAFKYAFKGIYQRIKGDKLTGYIWASLGFGDKLPAETLRRLFNENDPYKYAEGFTFNGRFRYSIPQYIKGKIIKLMGAKKLCSINDLLKQTLDYYLNRTPNILGAIGLGLYIPKPKKYESFTDTIQNPWTNSPQSVARREIRRASGCDLPVNAYSYAPS